MMFIQLLFLAVLSRSFVCASEGGCMLCGSGFPALDTRACEAKDKAISWLAGEQDKDGSWPPNSANTQNTLYGLQLADPSWLAEKELCERQLTKSRLEYQLLRELMPTVASSGKASGSIFQSSSSRWPSGLSPNAQEVDADNGRDDDSGDSCPRQFPRGAGVLAQYMLGLQSVCCRTDNFYEVDLDCTVVQLLKDFPETNFNNFFQYSLVIMSLCSIEEPIFRKALRKLANGPNRRDPCDVPGVDTLSMMVMAMVCSRSQAMEHGLTDWETVIDARVQCIKDKQDATTCAWNNGNDITTGLALQALRSAEAEPAECSCRDTVTWLLDQQEPSGSFGNSVGGTSQIIPLLNCNHFGIFLSNETINCPIFGEAPPPQIRPSDPTTNFKLKVDMNDGSSPAEFDVTIITNESLYIGMLRLEAMDVGFTFETQDSSFGRFLISVNGVATTTTTYWGTFFIKGGMEEPAQVGIESLIPEEDECFILRLITFEPS